MIPMETKHNVRRRRQERIKSLLERAGDAASAHPGNPNQRPERSRRTAEMSGSVAPAAFDGLFAEDAGGRMDDPEYVWKQQQKQLAAQYRGAYDEGGWNGFLSPRHMLFRLIGAALLFAAVWGLFQSDRPWAEKAQEAVRRSLTEQLDFRRWQSWYEAHFDGFPSLIPAFKSGGERAKEASAADLLRSFHSPVEEAEVIAPFSATHPGVVLKTPAAARVYSVETGRVTFSGETRQTGRTVIVQHAGGIRTIYGYLASTDLRENDWVEGGAVIGTAAKAPDGKSGLVYFSVQKDDRFLDPAELMGHP
jgi:stage IV sporulation protein FA